MHTLRLLLVCAWAVLAAAQTPPAVLDSEIARLDHLTADPDLKLQVVEAMAVQLGTHRNRLFLLKRQRQDSFAQIYVAELRRRGLSEAAILARLRAITARESETPRPAFRPIAYLASALDHNSAGTFTTFTPEVGLDNGRLALVAGLPVYRIAAANREAAGIGDAYLALFLRQPVRAFDTGLAFTLGAPTGSRDDGLGAGRVSVDLNATLQRRWERLRLFSTLGYTNSLFNNVAYQRPFIANGNTFYTTAGAGFRPHRRLELGLGGFALHAAGTQQVISQTAAAAARQANGMPGSPGMPGGTPGRMPPMSPGAGANTPFFGHAAQSNVPGSEVSDHGLSSWATCRLTPAVSLQLTLARSIAYELTTFRAALAFDLSTPFARLFRRGPG